MNNPKKHWEFWMNPSGIGRLTMHTLYYTHRTHTIQSLRGIQYEKKIIVNIYLQRAVKELLTGLL